LIHFGQVLIFLFYTLLVLLQITVKLLIDLFEAAPLAKSSWALGMRKLWGLSFSFYSYLSFF
jgi:hypothetical protein